MIRFVPADCYYHALTHGGTFHADDIMGMSVLEKIFDTVNIFRLSYSDENSDINQDAIIFDTLEGKFDHHQKNGNGYHDILNEGKEPIPYASFGLLWKEFGKKIIAKYGIYSFDLIDYVYRFVEINLVRGIDSADNGIYPSIKDDFFSISRISSIGSVISWLNLGDDDLKDNDSERPDLCLATKLASITLDIIIKEAIQNYNDRGDYSYKHHVKYKEDTTSFILGYLNRYMNQNYKDIKKSFYISSFDDLMIVISQICMKTYHDESEKAFIFYKKIVYGLWYDSLYEAKYDIGNSDYYNVFSVYDLMSLLIYHNEPSAKHLVEQLIDLTINNLIFNAHYYINSKDIVNTALENQKDSHILILEEKAFWTYWLIDNPDGKNIWFVISPSNGKWKIQPVPCKYNVNGYKKGFPSRWYGFKKGITNNKRIPPDIKFIHSKGFLAISDTKEAAITLCKNAFANTENIRKETTD